MKKTVFLSLLAALVLASCGNGKEQQQPVEQQEVKCFQQEQLESYIKIQVDSLANQWAKLQRIPYVAAIADGKLVLTDQQKLVKPAYLLDPASTNELVSLSQRYRAVGMLNADKIIAQAYDLDVAPYDAAMKRIVLDLNDPAYEALANDFNSNKPFDQVITEFYNNESTNGRINFFWESMTATLVEELYILTNSGDIALLDCFDDQTASEVSNRINLISLTLDQLKDYDQNLVELNDAIRPLGKLNAFDAKQFKEQVLSMKDDIVAVRSAMLK